MTWGGIFARIALIVFAGAVIVSAATASSDGISSRGGSSSAGGPVGLNIRTMDGRFQQTTIVWAGSNRELTVVNLSDPVAPGAERDVYDTMKMLLQRCTAINLAVGRASGPGGCCPTMSGSGVGFAGNVKTKLRIDQAFEGGRVRQTVTIYGYRGSFDAYAARLLFQ
ncbi:MAG: hypothetical protein KF889_17825 [Alphaproteobacteria bacterium]|nr:hypothetical protein [Alphaproteobacteria bacterium]